MPPLPRTRLHAPGALGRLALALLLAAGVAACGGREPAPAHARGGTPEAEAFGAAVAARVEREHPGARVERLGPLLLRVRLGEFEGTLALENAWRAHLAGAATPEEAARPLLEALGRASGGAQRSAPDPARFLPLVRDRGYVRELEAHAARAGARPGQVPFHEPLGGDLVVLYAEDGEGSLSALAAERLEEAGLSRAELARRARANLEARIPQARLTPLDALVLVELDGAYTASLLVVDAFWTPARFPVAGELLVAAPARGLLAVTGSRAPGGPAALRQLAERGVEELDHPVSATLLVRRGGRWEVYAEPAAAR